MPSGRSLRCRCPVCRHEVTIVVQAADQPDGRIVRRRRCAACEHRWFTVQEPEYLVPRSQVKYQDMAPRMVLREPA